MLLGSWQNLIAWCLVPDHNGAIGDARRPIFRGPFMSHAYRAWYLLAVLLLATPVAARVWSWTRARPAAVDPVMAQAGEVLFKHDWKPRDPLSPGGDGLGPVFNASSCIACHKQGGPGGGGGLEHNVTLYLVLPTRPGQAPRTGVVHAQGVGVRETLRDLDPGLPPVSQPKLEQIVFLPNGRTPPLTLAANVFLTQRNTPALFGARLIDALPARDIIAAERAQQLRWGLATSESEDVPVGRALRLEGGDVGRFGWKAQTATLAAFVQGACANELGLGNPGANQPRPISRPNEALPGLDLTAAQCDQLTQFCASLPPPVERLPAAPATREAARAGKALFTTVGCADCHTPNLGSVEGIYSDLLLHRMGADLAGGGGYYGLPVPIPDGSPGDGPVPGEWRTPPLWGVADSAPYMHDGRAATLEEAIQLHGGQGRRATEKFARLTTAEQGQLIAFLKTLRAP